LKIKWKIVIFNGNITIKLVFSKCGNLTLRNIKYHHDFGESHHQNHSGACMQSLLKDKSSFEVLKIVEIIVVT